MKRIFFSLLLFFSFIPFASAQFQFQSKDAERTEIAKDVGGPRLGTSQSQIWVTGVTIEAGTQAENVYITLPIPIDWPEQKVIKIEEVKLDAAMTRKLDYRFIDNDRGTKELIIQVDKLRPGRKFEVLVEVELLNYELLPPENSDNYVIPKRLHRDIEQYVKKSPLIESDSTKFLKLFNEITADKPTDWEKVEAIYSFVQKNVSYDETTRAKLAKGAMATISAPEGQWKGDCKDMSCLFVAICRAGKIPARLVRLPEHCYAEFYLEPKDMQGKPAAPVRDAKGAKTVKGPGGFWFPCQVAGSYSFGGIPERQPILQKGDSYPDRDSDNRKAKYIFLKEYCEASVPEGSPPPKVKFIHELKSK